MYQDIMKHLSMSQLMVVINIIINIIIIIIIINHNQLVVVINIIIIIALVCLQQFISQFFYTCVSKRCSPLFLHSFPIPSSLFQFFQFLIFPCLSHHFFF